MTTQNTPHGDTPPHLLDDAPLTELLSRNITGMSNEELNQHIVELRRIHQAPAALKDAVATRGTKAAKTKRLVEDLLADL